LFTVFDQRDHKSRPGEVLIESLHQLLFHSRLICLWVRIVFDILNILTLSIDIIMISWYILRMSLLILVKDQWTSNGLDQLALALVSKQRMPLRSREAQPVDEMVR